MYFSKPATPRMGNKPTKKCVAYAAYIWKLGDGIKPIIATINAIATITPTKTL
jgi:hypothetical protein